MTTAMQDQVLSPSARLEQARAAQVAWQMVPVRTRLRVLRNLRHLLARQAEPIADTFPASLPRSVADTVASEILPLAEGIRFLEQHAQTILKTRSSSSSQGPGWLGRIRLLVSRDPHGVVLIIGPANYPLFLPGIQALQALAAGNAVIWKPGMGGSGVARALADLLTRAGLPDGLLTITDETVDTARSFLSCGVDKVVLTGSEPTGRAVLRSASDTLTPAVVELSGCDAMFVLASADLQRAIDALLFSLRLNGSGTCIASRRIFVHQEIAVRFRHRLLSCLECIPPVAATPRTRALVRSLVEDALQGGAQLLTPDFESDDCIGPVCLTAATPEMRVMQEDVFAPIVSLSEFGNEAEMLAAAARCHYALGATVFGEQKAATRFAERIKTGIVVVNDAIAPTADPRIAFGGRARSGFGKSRGTEGLLEMTVSKTVAIQTARRLRHLELPHPKATPILTAFLRLRHGGESWTGKTGALLALARTFTGRKRNQHQ